MEEEKNREIKKEDIQKKASGRIGRRTSAKTFGRYDE